MAIYFKYGTRSDYDSLQTKDDNTLYFISDYGIYKGNQQIVSVNKELTADNSTVYEDGLEEGSLLAYLNQNSPNNEAILITINNSQLSAIINPQVLNWINDQKIDINEIPAPSSNGGFTVSGNTLTITDNSLLSDGLINDDDYLMVGWVFTDDERGQDCFSSVINNVGTASIDFRIFNTELINTLGQNYNNEGRLAVCLTDGNNNYYILLNENLFNNIIWGEFVNDGGNHLYIPIIHKNYILGTNNILNNMELYGIGYSCSYSNPTDDITELIALGNIADNDSMFFADMFLENFEDRTIESTYTISDFNFEYPPQE